MNQGLDLNMLAYLLRTGQLNLNPQPNQLAGLLGQPQQYALLGLGETRPKADGTQTIGIRG